MKRKRRDVAIIACTTPNPAATAGVFTTNVVRAPSVDRDEVVLNASPYLRAVVVNAGNANAGNGRQGEIDNETMAALAAKALDCDASAILTASTGVIGHPLPMQILAEGITEAARLLDHKATSAQNAAEAIMTTDTFVKEYAVAFAIGDFVVHVGGMSKGSGMIAPNMATMLGFLTTDVAITPELLHVALQKAVHVSFNSLTVDGDTSTNDSCVLMASGAASNPIIHDAADPRFAVFAAALTEVSVHLAKEIARDGEGATKLVTITCYGAETEGDARKVAKTIAESPLVKTALFGNDPNWGRILAAAGRAGVRFDPKQTTASLAGTVIFADGTPTKFDAPALSKAMAAKELEITIDLGSRGDAEATFYTCDFSYDYVRINAEYHT